VDKSRFGNPGDGTRTKVRYRKRGADTPKNESGRAGSFGQLGSDRRRATSPGNGTCIAVQRLSRYAVA
jgi:hypothetical protein